MELCGRCHAKFKVKPPTVQPEGAVIETPRPDDEATAQNVADNKSDAVEGKTP
jgi:hypothetical protein